MKQDLNEILKQMLEPENYLGNTLNFDEFTDLAIDFLDARIYDYDDIDRLYNMYIIQGLNNEN
jgi:hypothetical protein